MFVQLSTLPPESAEYKKLREAIISCCLPLADHIARRFKNRGEPVEDLIQVARVGLLNAVRRFDVENGSDFLSFAVPTMMGEVRRHFRDHGWSVKVPRRLKDLNVHINRASADLAQTLGRAPTASELAVHLDMDRDEVLEGLLASSAYSTFSTDVPAGADDERKPMSETIGDWDVNMDRVLDVETVRPLIAALPDRERTVLMLRFFENMTQTQIAERIGVSQMHVSRLLARAIASIRNEIRVPDLMSA
jgi:RNA polymerase sigma-B factor